MTAELLLSLIFGGVLPLAGLGAFLLDDYARENRTRS
jgi:hypothetical protein